MSDDTTYPRWLIRLFAVGVLLVLFAALAWPFDSLISSVLAAAGTSAIAWSLLRGEVIDNG